MISISIHINISISVSNSNSSVIPSRLIEKAEWLGQGWPIYEANSSCCFRLQIDRGCPSLSTYLSLLILLLLSRLVKEKETEAKEIWSGGRC